MGYDDKPCSTRCKRAERLPKKKDDDLLCREPGSCRASGGEFNAQECPEELRGGLLHVASPLEERHVLGQVLLAHSPERTEEVPQPRPAPLERIARHLANAVPVVVPRPLPYEQSRDVRG